MSRTHLRKLPDAVVLYARRCYEIRRRIPSTTQLALDAGIDPQLLFDAMDRGHILRVRIVTQPLLARALRARRQRLRIPSLREIAVRAGVSDTVLSRAVRSISYKHLRKVPATSQRAEYQQREAA